MQIIFKRMRIWYRLIQYKLKKRLIHTVGRFYIIRVVLVVNSI